ADGLSLPGEALTSSSAVNRALRRAEAERDTAQQRAHEEQKRTEDSGRQRGQLQQRAQDLRKRAVRWRELDTVASRLEGLLGAGLRTAPELESARQILDEARDHAQRQRETLQSAHDVGLDEARRLEQTGGFFHGDLIAARD